MFAAVSTIHKGARCLGRRVAVCIADRVQLPWLVRDESLVADLASPPNTSGWQTRHTSES